MTFLNTDRFGSITALFVMAAAWFGTLAVTNVVAAGDCCPKCGASCRLVECTVMVPVTVTETRVKNCIVKKEVQRQEEYSVFRRVDASQEFKKEICYLDDEIKSKEITQERCKVVNNPAIQSYRVKVPVCQEETHMVQTERCIDGEMVLVEEPCTKTVMREIEEVRERECTRPQLVFDEQKCTIDYCVKTPKTHTVPCAEETYFKLERETRTRDVTVCVPEIERRTYDVQVTKMYPKTVHCCPECAVKLKGLHQGGGSRHSDKGVMSKLSQHHKKLTGKIGQLLHH